MQLTPIAADPRVRADEVLAERVHSLLERLDPMRFDESDPGIATIEAERKDIARAMSGDGPVWKDALAGILREGPADDWEAYRLDVERLYAAFVEGVRAEGGAPPDSHATNHLRSLVHVSNGLVVAATVQWVFTPFWGRVCCVAFLVWAWSLEAARAVSPRINELCMWFFGPVARPHEHFRINSATWYGTAVTILAFTAYGPAGIMALLTLAVGDPTAGYFGRRFGRIKLGAKSLEGCLAFAISSAVLCFAYLATFQPQLGGLGTKMGLALLSGGVGAVIELISGRLEDNLTIPIGTAWVLQLTLWGLGLG